jgi:uncharacterized protein YjbJ (UPF0337 family)
MVSGPLVRHITHNTMEIQMGSTADKAKGYANEAAGNIKQGLGKAVGYDRLHASGVAQERKGEAQQAAGKIKEAVKDTSDAVNKAVKDVL